MAQPSGLILFRYVIEVEPLAGADPDDVARLFEPALRALMNATQQPSESEGVR